MIHSEMLNEILDEINKTSTQFLIKGYIHKAGM